MSKLKCFSIWSVFRNVSPTEANIQMILDYLFYFKSQV